MDNRQLFKTYTVLEVCSSFTKINEISIGNISSTVHSTCNWYGNNRIQKWVPRSRLAYQQTLFDKPTMLYTSNRSTILPGCFIINQLVRNNSFKSIHGFSRWVFCCSQDDEYRLESSFSLLPKKYSHKFYHEPETEQVRVVTWTCASWKTTPTDDDEKYEDVE